MQNLTVSYGRTTVLHDISAALPQGAITLLLGRNGSGKTTLLKTVAGLQAPQSGRVLLDGTDLRDYAPRARAKMRTYMPQCRPTPTVSVERLLLTARYPYLGLHRAPRTEDHAAVERAMTLTDTTALAARAVNTLSGGEQQRVYLAMALAQDTPLILLDEPTAHLDAATAFETAAILRRMKAQGHTVAAVLHDLPLALTLADHILLLDGGRLVFAGQPADAVAGGHVSRVFGVRVYPHEMDGQLHYLLTP